MKKKTTCFNKLTPVEKEALLLAFLQKYDPSDSINHILDNFDTLYIKWDGYRKDIIPVLRTVKKKTGSNLGDSWVSLQTKFENLDDIYKELELLSKNDRLSFRAKGIGAFLILQMFIDNELSTDAEAQKKMVHEYSRLKGESLYDIYGELKSTITKALSELGKHPHRGEPRSDNIERWKSELVLRTNLDIDKVNLLLYVLRRTDISWQAKGCYLYFHLYEPRDLDIINILNPNSSLEKGLSELSDYSLIK